MKYIYLIRHANAYPTMPGENDFDRELSELGKHEAAQMSQLLKDQNIKPDFMISSTAKRAATTANIFAEHLEYDRDKIHVEETLYASCLEQLLALTQKLNNQYATAFLFGHNPEISMYAQYLTGEITALPPCGVCAVRLNCDDWQVVERGLGQCILLEYPK